MFTKIYRYQLAPGTWESFIELQKAADELYRKHVQYQVFYIRDLENQWKVTEIQKFSDRKSAELANNMLKIEPSLEPLFKTFMSLLDPENSTVDESFGTDISIRDC